MLHVKRLAVGAAVILLALGIGRAIYWIGDLEGTTGDVVRSVIGFAAVVGILGAAAYFIGHVILETRGKAWDVVYSEDDDDR